MHSRDRESFSQWAGQDNRNSSSSITSTTRLRISDSGWRRDCGRTLFSYSGGAWGVPVGTPCSPTHSLQPPRILARTGSYCKEQTAYLDGLKTPHQTPSQGKCRGPALDLQNAAVGRIHAATPALSCVSPSVCTSCPRGTYDPDALAGCSHYTKQGVAEPAARPEREAVYELAAPLLTRPVTAQFSIGRLPLSRRRGRGRESVFVLAGGWGLGTEQRPRGLGNEHTS